MTQSDVSKIMFVILQNPNLTAKEIKKITNIPTTSTYRSIEFLVFHGLITSKTVERNVGNRTKIYRTTFSKLNFLVDTYDLKLFVA